MLRRDETDEISLGPMRFQRPAAQRPKGHTRMTAPIVSARRHRQPLGGPGLHRVAATSFRLTTLVETFTWVGLLTGMLFKYVINGNGMGVTVFGWIHGTVWLACVAAILLAGVVFRWNPLVIVVGLAASVLPFLLVPFAWWMTRSHRLGAPSASLVSSLPTAPPVSAAAPVSAADSARPADAAPAP